METTCVRIAFLTPEFPTEFATAGGLSSYLGRVSRTLSSMGHEVEVFTISHGVAAQQAASQEASKAVDYHGVRVWRVPSPAATWWQRGLAAPGRLWARLSLSAVFKFRREAAALADQLERRHREAPFEIVQSSDYGLAGLCVASASGRAHVVRCSSAGPLLDQLTGFDTRLDCRWNRWREQCLLRRVDQVYAPSRYVSDYQQSRLDTPIGIVRPPFFFESTDAAQLPTGLPQRYLFHFGNIGRVKGSDVVAHALRLAWQDEPDLKMVWAGTLPPRTKFQHTFPSLAARPDHVVWLGALEKPQLYGVLRRALATVAPSRCDNLPNNVLESLASGIPVIGSQGASMDELITPGVHGELVAIDDAPALASAMVLAWRGIAPFDGRSFPQPALFDEMEPRRAAEQLLAFAGSPRQAQDRQRNNHPC